MDFSSSPPGPKISAMVGEEESLRAFASGPLSLLADALERNGFVREPIESSAVARVVKKVTLTQDWRELLQSRCILAPMVGHAAKKLFLVDAMGFVFRAFFAPMARLNSPQGLPTKVPFLFSSMLRRLVKDHSPEYLGIVFDTPEPTFRDRK